MRIMPKNHTVLSSPIKVTKKKRVEQRWAGRGAAGFHFCFRKRESLLSRNTDDPTVGSLRNKKESCSTQRGFRVGTGFKEFRQTP